MFVFCLLFKYVLDTNAGVQIEREEYTRIESIELEAYSPAYYVSNEENFETNVSRLDFHPAFRLQFSKKL